MRAGEFDLTVLPPINATLNFVALTFLCLGFWAAKKKNIKLHRLFMASALGVSAVFLGCYLYYHFSVQEPVRYTSLSAWRYLYFFILFTHIPLAVTVVPGALMALHAALKNNIEKHRRIVRIVWPIWIYVSVTGVLIYLMLYQWQPMSSTVGHVFE